MSRNPADIPHGAPGTAQRTASEWALDAARKGWKVFPAYMKGWQSAATADPGVIVQLWDREPDRQPGLLTGQRSGLVVLHVEGLEGWASLERQTAEHGPLPETVAVVTPVGAVAAYFRHDGYVKSANGRFGRGLRLAAEGSWTPAPGYVDKEGRQCRYAVSPDVCPVAPLPDWLAANICRNCGQEIPAPVAA
jgi:putative DNA primase/helicase